MLSVIDEKYQGICDRLDAIAAAVAGLPQSDQTHSIQYREWEPFMEADAAAAVSNTATVALRTANQGWEARVHRISVTAAGASAAATVAVYRGGVSDLNLVDFASAMFGNTPSRICGDYSSPIEFPAGGNITIVVAGNAGATDVCTVRVEGYRRQV